MYWHTPSVLGIGAVLFIIIYLSAQAANDYDRQIPQGGEAVEATITRLASERTRLLGKPPGVVVAARTSEGAVGQVLAFPQEIAGCEPGDEIQAVQVGLRLYLMPRPCD